MELRKEDQKKQQEKIIKEMERTVVKRETIQLKYMNKEKPGNSGSLKLPKVNNPAQVTK